jgi:hypothetical protein
MRDSPVPHQGNHQELSVEGSQRVATLCPGSREHRARDAYVCALSDEHDRSTVARQGLGIFSQSDEYRDDAITGV